MSLQMGKRRTVSGLASPLPEATWEPDSASSACKSCGKMFSLTRRRHHCRSCGRLMCNDCTNKRWDFQGHFWGQRICSNCRYQLRVKSEQEDGKDAGKPKQRQLTMEAAMEQLELRSNRISELEDVVESVTFALDQVTRQRKLMLSKVAKMRLRMERLGTIAITAAEAKADERAAREHKCSTDVTVTFDAGPVGLALTNAPDGSTFAMEIEGFTKPVDGVLGQAEEFNKRVGIESCCGLLRKGMLLVSINAKTTATLTYSAVETRLRNARRPVDLVFRDIQFSQLRRRYNELQTRFSILSVQADLNRGALRATAQDALARVDDCNKLIAVLVKRFKLNQRQLLAATSQLTDAQAEVQRLHQARSDLEKRLAFTTGGTMDMGKTAKIVAKQRALQAAKAFGKELAEATKLAEDRLVLVEKYKADRAEALERVAKLERQMSDANEQTRALLNTVEQLQKGSGRKRGSGSDSGSDGEGLAAPRVRVEAGALWKLYRSEQQRRTLAEDESDALRDRGQKLESDLMMLKDMYINLQMKYKEVIANGGSAPSSSRRGTRSRARTKSDARHSTSAKLAAATRGKANGRKVGRGKLLALFAHKVEDAVIATHAKLGKKCKSRSKKKKAAVHAGAGAGAGAGGDASSDSGASSGSGSGSGSDSDSSGTDSGSSSSGSGSDSDSGSDDSGRVEQAVSVASVVSRASSGGHGSDHNSGSSSDEEKFDAVALATATTALTPGGVSQLTGYLMKSSQTKGGKMTGWKKRWVQVGGGALAYYASEQDMYAKGREDLRKLLHVAALNVSQIKHQFAFEVAVPGKKYFFRASDNAELHKWVSALTAILAKVREEKLAAAAAGGEESSGVSDVETVASSSDDEE